MVLERLNAAHPAGRVCISRPISMVRIRMVVAAVVEQRLSWNICLPRVAPLPGKNPTVVYSSQP